MLTPQKVCANLIQFESEAFLAEARSLEASMYFKQWREGRAHPLWLLGHVAIVNDSLINVYCCDGKPLFPEEWSTKFLPSHRDGVAPTSAVDFYPSWDELIDCLKEVVEVGVNGVNALSDEQMVGQLRGNAPRDILERFGTVENTLRFSASHSAYHRGQLSLIRLQG